MIIQCGLFLHIYHIGCALNLHSIINNGLIPEENVQHVRELDSDHPVNHPNEQKQFLDDSTPERQSSNQTRERTFERSDEPPTQRPRLENPARSIRWARVDDPRQWVPTTAVNDDENMWTDMDLRCCGSSKLTITFGRTMGNLHVCAKKSGMSSSAKPVKSSLQRCASVSLSSLV